MSLPWHFWLRSKRNGITAKSYGLHSTVFDIIQLETKTKIIYIKIYGNRFGVRGVLYC